LLRQCGSRFDRNAALGYRLDIPAGTAVRFEPGQSREVWLVPYAGERMVYGFNQAVMGALLQRRRLVGISEVIEYAPHNERAAYAQMFGPTVETSTSR